MQCNKKIKTDPIKRYYIRTLLENIIEFSAARRKADRQLADPNEHLIEWICLREVMLVLD